MLIQASATPTLVSTPKIFLRIRVTHLSPGLALDAIDMVPHLPEGPGPAHPVQEGDPVLLPFLLPQICEVLSHGNYGIP
ncbi:hypothetical protein E2C01_063840 [Portunus trituberculatus]|uniref:Uncharacterized protein n=1 Tax=Portunus trituberculatus TaxID=210409 RepID=A0A5B7HBK6_PORTR|nr:hypothetical protein [Portunus trituberculatus]